MGFGRGAGFRDPANHVDLKQAVLEGGALDRDMIGEAPHDVVGRIVPKISVTPVGQERAARDVALAPSGDRGPGAQSCRMGEGSCRK
jgi:hypothetical protein